MIQQLLTVGGDVDIPIGTLLEGGYFAGYISHTANGVATHGLIVAPAASGYNGGSKLKWKTSSTITSGSPSTYDGAANTAAVANTDHPAANYCAGLTIGGYSDWYLPARYELDIAYYNLKPSTTQNATNVGTNAYSVPARNSNYTQNGDPTQTSVALFQSGGAEAFIVAAVTNTTYHWSSWWDASDTTAWGVHFNDGSLDETGNGATRYVRAFRKFAV